MDCFERKTLRRIFGPVMDKGLWRIRYNGELYKLYDDIALSTLIRLKRLKWAGHIVRMEEERIPRKVLDGHFGGKRMVGRPRIQWEEMVRVDAKNLLGIRNWRTMARRRDDWKALIGEAMVRRRAEEP